MDDADSLFDTEAFLALLRRGDQGAYRRLIRRYHATLVSVAQGIIGSRAQAEEVVQDTWLAVYRHIGRFEGRSSLAGWIFTIATNRARTRIGAEGRTVALPGLDGVERAVDESRFKPDGHWQELPALWDVLDPERVVAGQQLWEHVQAAIEALPPAQKAAIVLRDIENRSAEEACALLGVSPENQRVLLHRARGRVRAAIDAVMAPPSGGVARSEPARIARGKPARPGAWGRRAWAPAIIGRLWNKQGYAIGRTYRTAQHRFILIVQRYASAGKLLA